MEKIITLLAVLCWQTIHAQEQTWGLQVATLPLLSNSNEDNNPHYADPGFVISTENKYTFHNLVFNPVSHTFTNLNIVIGKKADYYCFFSYSPREDFCFTAFGGSKTFKVKGGGEITPYAEWGCENFDAKSWLIEVGIVYALELGPIQFRHKNKRNKRRDHS